MRRLPLLMAFLVVIGPAGLASSAPARHPPSPSESSP